MSLCHRVYGCFDRALHITITSTDSARQCHLQDVNISINGILMKSGNSFTVVNSSVVLSSIDILKRTHCWVILLCVLELGKKKSI